MSETVDFSLDSDESVDDFLDPVMEPFNPSDIDIVIEILPLGSLIERVRYEEIDMDTAFQRHADLWDNGKMSRLIESVLIRLPLPPFYFDASNNRKWLVVDGLQRLSTIRKFVISKELRLTGLEFLTELQGKTVDELHPAYQRRINEAQMTAHMIKPGTPPDVKYSIFRRINTGGLTLNNQEIRNALAGEKERKLLQELSAHPWMQTMMGDLSKRMKDQELVLRFWAFYSFDYLAEDNRKSLALFLDRAMEDLKQGDQAYREQLSMLFVLALSRCRDLLGVAGFEKNPGAERRSKNATLFEVWMSTLVKLSNEEFQHLLDNNIAFSKSYAALLGDSEFVSAISYNTQKTDHVALRYARVNQLLKPFLEVAE